MNIGLVVIVAMVLWSGVAAAQAQRVPCYFIFGDSSADNGNNNQLWSNARANYLPYGIDSSVGPTGRFSNGKTTVDVIAELLGLAGFIRPYASAGARDIFYGVNYASAASGIRDETGQQLGSRISLRGQVQNHIRTAYQMLNSLGDVNRTLTYLGRCIYSIGVGGDDYLNNYFMPQFYPTSSSTHQSSMLIFFSNHMLNYSRFCTTMGQGKWYYLGLVR
uniref:GDSL esterase/lipase n=1 Tax=Glycine max TaxID=3847 RepID=C6TE64_SOYBN|nr:unknown [Glycine max]